MPVLYFDNFRGFDKTFLPLQDVNFFIGENSTGKTSVLKLIKTLSDYRFWFMEDFSSEEAELGYYSEIASLNHPEKKYFEVGILGNKDKDNSLRAMKIRYVNKRGLPEVSEICMIDNNFNIQGIAQNGALKYRYSEANIKRKADGHNLKFFKKWISDNELGDEKYIELKGMPNFFKRKYFLQINNIIADITGKKATKANKEKNKKRFSGLDVAYFPRDIAWLAPIRTEPKRTYDSYRITFKPDGTHAPYLIKRLINRNGKKKNKAEQILQKFGEDSGLFEKISINKLGNSETSPFELHVHHANTKLQITNVGYGVSQILPIVIEIIARSRDSWFAIQQPEIHLHPRGQAAFGDFIFKSFENENKSFIIETHSDYTIDRFRLRLNKKFKTQKSKKNVRSQIVFFKHCKEGNELVYFPINSDGSFPEEQPKEFREFFVKEQLNIIQI